MTNPIHFSLAISHTPWIAERVESMRRLALQLGVPYESKHEPPEGLGIDYRIVEDRVANDVWSERMWSWAAETTATHCVFLQDDVEVAPNFWPALRAIVEARPDDVVGLEVAHPAARMLALEDFRLFTTSDMLIGPGYVVPREQLVEFLEWRKTRLVDGWRTAGADGKPGLTEDTMIGLWCMTTGRRIVHPVPTIIDHDTSIPSTYGNDDHTHRKPYVTWKDAEHCGHAWEPADLEAPGFWQGRFKRIEHRAPDGSFLGYARAHNTDLDVIRGGMRVPHLGRFYSMTPTLARQWMKGFGSGDLARARADDGGREKRRIAYAVKAQHAASPARERVLICTPTRGGLHPTHTMSLLQTVQLLEVDIEHGIQVLDSWQWHEDVVRVRSRFLRMARETDCTAVHFRDSDVTAPPIALIGMLASGRELVCTPYPRRDTLDLAGVVAATKAGDDHPERAAHHYPVGFLPGDRVLEGDCLRMAWMPLGCSIVRRSCFERMIQHFEELDEKRVDLKRLDLEKLLDLGRGDITEIVYELAEELKAWRAGHMGLRFVDRVGAEEHETVALFQLMTRASEETGVVRLWGEDQSFCLRWRDLGGEVWMYLGPGAPANHAGDFVFEGRIEALGFSRDPPT